MLTSHNLAIDSVEKKLFKLTKSRHDYAFLNRTLTGDQIEEEEEFEGKDESL